jgi:hypothetical protein
MRRAIIECAVSDFVGSSIRDITEKIGQSAIDKIESFEVLNFLTNSTKEFAVIGRVKFKNPSAKFRDVFTSDVRVLEQEGKGRYVCFFRARLGPESSGIAEVFPEGYPFFPIEIRHGRLKLTFIGSAKAVRKFLEALKRMGLHYRLIMLTDTKFPPNSPLGLLTEKQRKVIATAFSLGYYDSPRRISSEELAKKLNIREPTMVRHRRKAERRLLAEILHES